MRQPRLRRSLLITPGHQLDRIRKAAVSPADAVVMGIEDGVSPEDKPAARRAIRELSITHKFRDQRRGADADFLESQESVVIPCLAPDSKSRVLDGDEKQQIGVACTRIRCVGGTRRG